MCYSPAAVPLSEIQGQEAAVAQLRAAIHGQRLHHAYLVSGFPGVGVPDAAARFAEALLCPLAPEGCGSCSVCDRARRGLHPDLLRAGLDREAGAREVKVEAIRALCGALQLKASEGVRKVALIADADRLSPSAQNALLKTLEEPPPRTVLILASEADDRLLPTVRSRCVRVGLGPMPEALLIDRLVADKTFDRESAVLAARLARGSLTRAESFRGGAGGGFRERRNALLAQAEALLLARGQPAAALLALELAERFADGRERTAEALDVLTAFLRDLLVSVGARATPGGAQRLLSPDRAAALARLAAQLSPSEILRALAALSEAAEALEGNGVPRLQLEAAGLRLGGLSP